MAEIVDKVLLTGDSFLPKLHLRQPRFTYSALGPFNKHCERIQKFKETSDLNQIYKNGLDKAFFADDAAYADIKYVSNRTVSDKVLKYRNYKIALNPNYDGYQRELASLLNSFLIIKQNQQRQQQPKQE